MNLYLKGNGPFPRMPLKVLLGLSFSSFCSFLITVENESQLIGGGPIDEFQIPSPMSHVHRHGQHAGSIGVNAYAVRPIMTQLPVMTPLASVRSDYNDLRTIVIDSGDVANSQEHYQCHDHLAYSSVDTSHFLHTNTPNKDTPGRPVDTKCRSTVKPTGLLIRNSTASAQNARYDLNFNGGPEDMRNQLVELESVNGNLQEKFFSKEPKANVTSAKSREASDSRRKNEAKFTCPFEGCNGNFTRKHNLDSECSICFDIMSF